MTRGQALCLIRFYEEVANEDPWAGGISRVMNGIRDRFPDDGSVGKAMRWLGFCQGVMLQAGVYTLDELKAHSKDPDLLILGAKDAD